MSRFNKNARLTVRMTTDQRSRVERAAKIVTRRRGEVVDDSQLVRELVMPQVDEILAGDKEEKRTTEREGVPAGD